MTTTTSTIDEIRQRYENAGQGHVFQYYNTFDDNEEQRTTFLNQLDSIPVEHLNDYLIKAQEQQQEEEQEQGNNNNKIQPFSGPVVSLENNTQDNNKVINEWRTLGLKAIQEGHVAAVVLAGGQGTRLGFHGPKGCYNIGLPSQKSLFQLLMERLERLQQLATCSSSSSGNNNSVISLYVMTSPLNHKETVSFFEKHDNFQTNVKVYFFPQGMLPCLTLEEDDDGNNKIILEGPNKVAMAPDGNGGIYTALHNSGMLQQMKKEGVHYLHVFSIDNALCRPADPIFVGYCLEHQADCGNKVVWKKDAHEKVGVLAETSDGRPCIVEYSDLSREMAEATTTDKDNQLVFGAANICNHFYTLDFIQNQVLPNMANLYHVAKKKIPYYNGSTSVVITPDQEPNGIKLESFIFDVFFLSKRMAVFNVQREEEFAPVKNATGNDSPSTARTMVSNVCQAWLQTAGAELIVVSDDKEKEKDDDDNDEEEGICEISPLTSYAGEGLETKYNGCQIQCPFRI